MFEKNVSLTSGNVARGMLVFAVPIFFSNLFQQLYNAVDSLIVGNFLGGDALAAVGSSGSLIFLLTGFVNGVSLGAGVLVARHYGAKDDAALRRAVHTTVALGITAGVVLSVVGVLLTPQILRWMDTPENVLPNSIIYFRVYFMGSLAVVMYNMGASILQSVGDSRSPMRYLITASILNVILDLWFIAGLHMGVGGAAFATIISQTVSAGLAFRKLTLTKEAYGVRWRQVRFHPATLRAVVAQGVPSGVQNSVISIANVIVQANINAFGANAMAGCGAYSKVEGFVFLPVTCFSMALATFVQPEHRRRAAAPGAPRHAVRHRLFLPAGRMRGSGHVHHGPHLHRRLQRRGRRGRLRRAAGAHRLAVLLPAGLQPLLRRHPAGPGTPRGAHGHHAGHMVCPAHHLHHHHGALYPPDFGGLLGLPHHLGHQLAALRLVPDPLPHARSRRRGTAASGLIFRQTQPQELYKKSIDFTLQRVYYRMSASCTAAP